MTTHEKRVSQHMAMGQEDSGIQLADSHVREQSITQIAEDSLGVSDSGIGWNLRASITDTCGLSQGGSVQHSNAFGLVGVSSVTSEPVSLPPSPSTIGSPTYFTIDNVPNSLPVASSCGFTPVNSCRLVATEYYSSTRTTAIAASEGGTVIQLTGTTLLTAGQVISFGTGLISYTVVGAVVNGSNSDVTVTPALMSDIPISTQVRLLNSLTLKRPQFSTSAGTSMAIAANSTFDGLLLRYGSNRPIIQTINLRLILESEAKRLLLIEFLKRTVGYVVEISTNLYGGQPAYTMLSTPIVEFSRLSGDNACSIWGTSLSFVRKIQ